MDNTELEKEITKEIDAGIVGQINEALVERTEPVLDVAGVLPEDQRWKPDVYQDENGNYQVRNWESGSQIAKWIIVGDVQVKGKGNRGIQKLPIYRFIGWNINKKYTGADLRKLRAEKGVGNVKKIKK